MVENADLSEPLFLIQNGVSEETAFNLPPDRRRAWCISMGMHKGGKFNWDKEDWEEPK